MSKKTRRGLNGEHSGAKKHTRWDSKDWSTAIIIPLILLVVALFLGDPAARWTHDMVFVRNDRPELQEYGELWAVTTLKYPVGEQLGSLLVDHQALLTGPGAFSGPSGKKFGLGDGTAGLDLPNGSLLAYNQTIWNSGRSELRDLTVRLNLPGNPIVATTDRGEATTEVAPISLYLWNGTSTIGPVILDPRALAPPHWDRYYNLTTTYEEGPRNDATLWNATFRSESGPSWVLDISNDSSAFIFQSLVGTSGSKWVSYHLPTLQPRERWNITTYYFGNRTGQEAGGHVSAAGLGYGDVWYYKIRRLTIFDHPPVRAAGEPTWIESPHPIREAEWPLKRSIN